MSVKKKNKSPVHRLDDTLVQRGLAESKEKAQAMIMAGDVLVNQQVIHKADHKVPETAVVERKEKYPFVSRGADKIERAFRFFQVAITGNRALDIGISTGGFSDYMLQNGAAAVTGVDVNIAQVDDKLIQDPRVTLIKANARNLTKHQLQYTPHIITIDVSFISITKILPALTVFPEAKIITLVKPQFEAKKENVGKGGIIHQKEKRVEILLELKEKIINMGYAVTGFSLAGVKGRKGNQEYFFLLEYGKKPSINDTIIIHEKETKI